MHQIRRALRSTALCTLSAMLLCPWAAAAFNPNEGAEAPVAKAKRSHLPSTAPLIEPMPKLVFPSPNVPRQTPVENTSVSASSNPAPVTTTYVAPSFPPVDAAVAARAAQEMQSASSLPPAVIAAPPNFSAPAPLLTTSSAMPAALPEPIAAAPVAPTAPALTPASRTILSNIPSKLNTQKAPSGGKLAINRMSPDIKALVNTDAKIESYDAVGLSIKVARPGLDTNFELNRAYTSLMGGDSAQAIATYKNILSTEPNNEDALFGLASTYHRLGNLESARPYYGQLLKINPGHREGLNNFLALISDESPQEALAELERLEQRNPDFSPIPAQESLVLAKLGYADQAREKILRAIELAPDNLTYKYNLAVMLDKQGRYADASALYRLLIDASLKGEKLPTTLDILQKRLNFITTAAAPTAPVGG